MAKYGGWVGYSVVENVGRGPFFKGDPQRRTCWENSYQFITLALGGPPRLTRRGGASCFAFSVLLCPCKACLYNEDKKSPNSGDINYNSIS